MFFGLTGMPMRNSVLAKMPLALAEPEPLTVANFTTKSLMPLIYELASSVVRWGQTPRRTLSSNQRCAAGSDPIASSLSADRHCDASDKPVKPALPRT